MPLSSAASQRALRSSPKKFASSDGYPDKECEDVPIVSVRQLTCSVSRVARNAL
jgi:hypothetical protein